ncbi:MAG: flagellar motor switch phosphatase FliY [Synergistetes bacterium]|nr:flagellar motor switch phosphatase FliY [Synergistota bacterium]
MSDGLLTQEEIDALLKAQAGGGPSPAEEKKGDNLSPEEIDALKEMGSVVMGSASTVLSTLVNKPVEITVKEVKEGKLADIYELKKGSNLLLKIEFTEGIMGNSAVILGEKEALAIADFMMGGDGSQLPEELNELYQSAVNEALSQMMGSMTTTLSTLLGGKYVISPPSSEKVNLDEKPELISGLTENDSVVYLLYSFKIGDVVDGEMLQVFPLDMAKDLASKLLASASEAGESVSEEVQVESQSAPAAQQPTSSSPPTPTVQAPQPAPPPPPSQPAVEARPAQFAPLQTSQTSAVPPKNIELILDVPLKVTVELGKTRMLIRDILNLGPGSIIELDKLAGEPVEILVNGKPIARGEVVVIDENFGVRITDIISPRERLESLT